MCKTINFITSSKYRNNYYDYSNPPLHLHKQGLTRVHNTLDVFITDMDMGEGQGKAQAQARQGPSKARHKQGKARHKQSKAQAREGKARHKQCVFITDRV